MYEGSAGEWGFPAPTKDGRRQRPHRHRQLFRQDTNGIQMGDGRSPIGYEQDTNHGGTAMAGQVFRRYSRGRV